MLQPGEGHLVRQNRPLLNDHTATTYTDQRTQIVTWGRSAIERMTPDCHSHTLAFIHTETHKNPQTQCSGLNTSPRVLFASLFHLSVHRQGHVSVINKPSPSLGTPQKQTDESDTKQERKISETAERKVCEKLREKKGKRQRLP